MSETRGAGQPSTRTTALVRWVGELMKFGAVGGVAFIVDLGLFNILTHFADTFLAEKPLISRTIAAIVATVVSWLGNRYWTFRDRRAHGGVKEFVLYGLINGVGILLQTGTLAVSRYIFHLDSQLWDNVAFVVGVGIATIFRYLTYRFVVFNGKVAGEDEPDVEEAELAVTAGVHIADAPPVIHTDATD